MVVIALLALTSLWYVQTPPRTAGDYRERAGMTAELLRSQAESARLWVSAVEADRTPRQTATVGLREAEEDAVEVAAEFAGWDPPTRALRELRSELTAAADETTSALGAIRIATEDERWDELGALAQPLTRLAERLERLARTAAE